MRDLGCFGTLSKSWCSGEEVQLVARVMVVIVIGIACCEERFHWRSGNNDSSSCVVSAGGRRADNYDSIK